VKTPVLIATVMLLALAVVVGGPTSMAQDEPENVAPTDQEMPVTPCPPAADIPLDENTDPEAVFICTPTDAGADMLPPVDTPIDAPMPVPTDTPVPAPADTPPPTETPTPVPTDTPTPMPAIPTETPTPTSGSRDVPVGTLSRQLPFANPGEDECLMDLDTADKQSCKPQTFPAVFTISFNPWSSTAPITIRVDGRKPETTSSITWDFLSVPGGLGPDTHTITASETFGGIPLSAKLSVPVQKANSPHFLVYPRVMPPGSRGKIYLAGFPGNTVLPLGVYRERQDCNAFGQGNECFELSRDLGTVKTDADGTVTREFSIPVNEKQTAYLIATTGLQIDPLNVADSLKKLGRPWFVVGQP
jgi:hypothetical protein